MQKKGIIFTGKSIFLKKYFKSNEILLFYWFCIWEFVLYEIAHILMFNVHTIFFNNPVVAYFDTKFWIYSFIFANFTKYFSPWNLMTTSIDVLFNTCLWINLMSAIYWMCYLFHSICGKRKPWIKLKGRAQIDLSHVIVTVDFITVILSLNDHLKYRNFITPKNTNHYYCSPSFKHWFIGPKKLSCFIFWQRRIYIL